MTGWHFRRDALGREVGPYSWTIEACRIAALCEAIGESSEIHFDEEAARRAGYAGIVAPPTFAHVIDEETARQARKQGNPTVLDLIGADLRYIVHGSETYDLFAPMLSGDTVTIRHRIDGFELKKGGALDLARVTSRIGHPERGLLTTVSRIYIHVRPEGSA